MNPDSFLESNKSIGLWWLNKPLAILKIAGGLVEAARPGMWLKPLFLMLVASTYALHDFPDFPRLLGGFLIVGPLLWGGLYMLNAVTDVDDDKQHPVKKLRPFASSRVSPHLGLGVSLFMIGTAILFGLQINSLFALCILVMSVKQIAYTVPPLRLKRFFLWDVLSGSIGNSTLRFASGWFLFTDSLGLPVLLLVFSECLQLAGFLVNRLFTNYSSGIERQLNYSSTSTQLNVETIRRIIIGCWAIGIACFVLLICNSIVRLYPAIFGVLPAQTLIVLMLLLIAVPFFARAMERADKFTYRESQIYYDLPLLYVSILSVLLSFLIKTYGQ